MKNAETLAAVHTHTHTHTRISTLIDKINHFSFPKKLERIESQNQFIKK